jgi:hypothetical protein
MSQRSFTYLASRRAVLTAALLCAHSACYQAERSAAAPAPPSEAEPDTEEADASGQGSASSARQLTFRVETLPTGGRFAPNNVGAIWIEDGQGAFVRTLALWGRSRAMYLRKFQASSQGNSVDAVTGATLSAHALHEVSWNLLDRSGREIPDGPYLLRVEMTDKNIAGALLELPFEKTPEPLLDQPADAPYFRAIELRIE